MEVKGEVGLGTGDRNEEPDTIKSPQDHGDGTEEILDDHAIKGTEPRCESQGQINLPTSI